MDTQQAYHQNLTQGFENMGLGDNVFTPAVPIYRTNKLKSSASTINPYEYGTGQVNPYASGQDMFYQPSQAYHATMPVILESFRAEIGQLIINY